MVSMKTTVLIEDKVYKRLVEESIKNHGTAKNISATLNKLLKTKLSPTSSMFGKIKRFSLKGLREKYDRTV
jgi:hypothetical protein